MTHTHPHPNDETPESLPRENDLTVDLTLDGYDEEADLQAVADAAAESTPEPVLLDAEALPQENGKALQEAQERIRALEKLEVELVDKHHRLLADFANLRNRGAREIQMAVDQAEKKLLLEILPVLDSFDRCINAQYQGIEDFSAGVTLINKQFLDAIRRLGVERVGLQVGDPFNAQVAEALTTTCNPELPDGAVAAVFENGFTLRDSLLRAARVVVNRAEPSLPE